MVSYDAGPRSGAQLSSSRQCWVAVSEPIQAEPPPSSHQHHSGTRTLLWAEF